MHVGRIGVPLDVRDIPNIVWQRTWLILIYYYIILWLQRLSQAEELLYY